MTDRSSMDQFCWYEGPIDPRPFGPQVCEEPDYPAEAVHRLEQRRRARLVTPAGLLLLLGWALWQGGETATFMAVTIGAFCLGYRAGVRQAKEYQADA